jgi:hypothetical protein
MLGQIRPNRHRSGVVGDYDHYDYQPEIAEALAKWRALEPGFAFRRRALELKQERTVDPLDIDPPSCTAGVAFAISTNLRAAMTAGLRGWLLNRRRRFSPAPIDCAPSSGSKILGE